MNAPSIIIESLTPVIATFLPLLLAVVAFKLYSPVIIGWLGERNVRGILDGLNSQAYTQLHDVLLPIDGETTQIDHVVISGDTCFVIETKAYAGWIFGSANAQQWTQSFNKRSKFQFQSPIRQNYKHILAIKPFLEGLKVVGVVVFTRGTFKSPRIDGVLYSSELKSFLTKHKVNKAFDNSAALQALQKAMITDPAEHKAHVRRLQAKHGGRWRIPLAKAMLLAALALLVFSFGMESYTPTNMVETQSFAPVQGQQESVINQRVAHAPVTQQVDPAHRNLTPPIVSGFVKGKVIIQNGKNYRMLKVGQKTKDGWTLDVAGSTSAVFSHASGKRVKVTVRGVENE